MDPFLGEIRIVTFNFAPRGWAFCDGQLLSISQNTALFALLGTTYGGNGTTIFALPNLQNRVPVHRGQGLGLTLRHPGEMGDTQTATLTSAQMPAHGHQAMGCTGGGAVSPENKVWGRLAGRTPPPLYSSAYPNVTMSPTVLGVTGSSLPHNNMQPYLALNFVIALQGIFPLRQ